MIPEKLAISALQKRMRPAYLLRRNPNAVARDDHSNSYLGGLPRLPSDFAWPEIEHEGTRCGLLFLGQIDFADLGGNSDLPTEGALYFFYFDNSYWGEAETLPCRVIYSLRPPGDFPLRSPPIHMVPLSESPDDNWSEDYHRCGAPRYNIDFTPVDSFPEHYMEHIDELFPELEGKAAELAVRSALKGKEDDYRFKNVVEELDRWGAVAAWRRLCWHTYIDAQRNLQDKSIEQSLGGTTEGFLPQHQLLGYANFAAMERVHPSEYSLLLRVDCADEAGVWPLHEAFYHFWISPQDIAARRFSGVILEIGHV